MRNPVLTVQIDKKLHPEYWPGARFFLVEEQAETNWEPKHHRKVVVAEGVAPEGHCQKAAVVVVEEEEEHLLGVEAGLEEGEGEEARQYAHELVAVVGRGEQQKAHELVAVVRRGEQQKV